MLKRRSIKIFLIFLLLPTFVYGSTIKKARDELSVLAFGDSGTGSVDQMRVAEAMKKSCQTHSCKLALMLGDNFYEDGVTSTDDLQFIQKFEKPYGPLEIPFWAVLGNHDYRGNPRAQIDYTKKSQWWKMPSEYFDFMVTRQGIEDGVHFIGIDTNKFDKEQQRYLTETLQASKARWKVVFGHHPIYSYGAHGSTLPLIKDLLPIICKNASIYIAGHDHDMQVLRPSCGVPLVVSGAAGKLRPVKVGKETLFATSQFGFSILGFANDYMAITFYDDHNRVVHESSFAHQ